MATETGTVSTSDTAILSRLIRGDESLSIDAAESLLRIRFEPDDLARIHDLTIRNQGDQLNPEERTELENCRRVSYLLDLMHSKARRALKKHQSDGPR